MAMFNEILVGRYNKALNAVFGIKAGAPAPSLAGDVTPIYLVDGPVEDKFLGGWKRWGWNQLIPVVAAQFPVFQLTNPANSGVIAVIEKIIVQQNTNPGATQIRLNTSAIQSFGSLTPSTFIAAPLDTRMFPISSSSLQGASGNSVSVAGSGLPFLMYQLPATFGVFIQDVQFFREQSFVLSPGFQLTAFNNVLASDLYVSLWWRERSIEETETRL